MRAILATVACLLLVPLVYSVPGPVQVGPGIAFSGAGGRIAQLYALMEVLVNGEYPNGVPIRPAFVSGVSSGSIIAVLTSAIFEQQETGRNNMTWAYALQIFSEMKNSWVVDDSYEGYAEIPLNMMKGYVLNNQPEMDFLTRIVHAQGYYKLKDLYLPTFISVVHRGTGQTVRLSSLDPTDGELDIIEVLMASTAIPVAFQPRLLTGLGSSTDFFVDGGTGIDQLPTTDLLQEPFVTHIYALSYGSAVTSGGDSLPKWLEDVPLLFNSLAAFQDMRVQITLSGLSVLSNQRSKKSWQYIPDIPKSFGTLDFDSEIEQYKLVRAWALQNAPLRLNPQML